MKINKGEYYDEGKSELFEFEICKIICVSRLADYYKGFIDSDRINGSLKKLLDNYFPDKGDKLLTYIIAISLSIGGKFEVDLNQLNSYLIKDNIFAKPGSKRPNYLLNLGKLSKSLNCTVDNSSKIATWFKSSASSSSSIGVSTPQKRSR